MRWNPGLGMVNFALVSAYFVPAWGHDALRVLTSDNPHLDYPASGLVLFGLGAWSLLRRAAPAGDALRLLALADRFAYNRMVPTMRWERITPAAEEAAPGLLARLQAEYRDCPQPGLLTQARLAVERLLG